MSEAADAFLRKRGTRRVCVRPSEEEQPEKPKPPLISQGARSSGYPRPLASPDELIRRGRRGSGNPWTPVF